MFFYLRFQIKVIFLILSLFFLVVACSTTYLKYEKEDALKSNEEFEDVVKIQEAPPEAPAAPTIPGSESDKKLPLAAPDKTKATGNVKPGTESKSASRKKTKKGKDAQGEASPQPPARQPDLEDTVGFQGRRPLVDPFRVGEKITHNVHYFKVSAGTLTMSLDPFVQVNGRKSYNFVFDIETSSLFSKFYSVKDRATVLMDYEELIPRVYTLNVKETGQLREARSFFDFDKGVATFWEKKYTKKHGHEERKESWEILPYSQNVFSAVHYMRVFQWDVGKEISFRVADDKQNLVFRGKCLRREKLKTEVGEFTALVIKPEFTLQGKFKPVGENLIWISDDDRKFILRIESSIKIGTLVSEIVALEPGG